jgi:hypothetical protein
MIRQALRWLVGSDPRPNVTFVERVTLADLRAGDIVWEEDGFWPVREAANYSSEGGYVGYTIVRDVGPARITGVPTNPILRVVAG